VLITHSLHFSTSTVVLLVVILWSYLGTHVTVAIPQRYGGKELTTSQSLLISQFHQSGISRSDDFTRALSVQNVPNNKFNFTNITPATEEITSEQPLQTSASNNLLEFSQSVGYHTFGPKGRRIRKVRRKKVNCEKFPHLRACIFSESSSQRPSTRNPIIDDFIDSGIPKQSASPHKISAKFTSSDKMIDLQDIWREKRQEEEEAEAERLKDLNADASSNNPFINTTAPISSELQNSFQFNMNIFHPLFNSDTVSDNEMKKPENKSVAVTHNLSRNLGSAPIAHDLLFLPTHLNKRHPLLNKDSVISSNPSISKEDPNFSIVPMFETSQNYNPLNIPKDVAADMVEPKYLDKLPTVKTPTIILGTSTKKPSNQRISTTTTSKPKVYSTKIPVRTFSTSSVSIYPKVTNSNNNQFVTSTHFTTEDYTTPSASTFPPLRIYEITGNKFPNNNSRNHLQTATRRPVYIPKLTTSVQPVTTTTKIYTRLRDRTTPAVKITVPTVSISTAPVTTTTTETTTTTTKMPRVKISYTRPPTTTTPTTASTEKPRVQSFTRPPSTTTTRKMIPETSKPKERSTTTTPVPTSTSRTTATTTANYFPDFSTIPSTIDEEFLLEQLLGVKLGDIPKLSGVEPTISKPAKTTEAPVAQTTESPEDSLFKLISMLEDSEKAKGSDIATTTTVKTSSSTTTKKPKINLPTEILDVDNLDEAELNKLLQATLLESLLKPTKASKPGLSSAEIELLQTLVIDNDNEPVKPKSTTTTTTTTTTQRPVITTARPFFNIPTTTLSPALQNMLNLLTGQNQGHNQLQTPAANNNLNFFQNLFTTPAPTPAPVNPFSALFNFNQNGGQTQTAAASNTNALQSLLSLSAGNSGAGSTNGNPVNPLLALLSLGSQNGGGNTAPAANDNSFNLLSQLFSLGAAAATTPQPKVSVPRSTTPGISSLLSLFSNPQNSNTNNAVHNHVNNNGGLFGSQTGGNQEANIQQSSNNMVHQVKPQKNQSGLYYWLDLNAFLGGDNSNVNNPASGFRPKLGDKEKFIKTY